MTYIQRFYGITPNCHHDTMCAQHLIWPGTQKDLGYLSSIYCEYHRYWKDDNKEWDAKGKLSEHFLYNGEDGLRSFEIHLRQLEVINKLNIKHLWAKELLKLKMAFEMSIRGVKIDMNQKAMLSLELSYASQERIARLLQIVPQTLVDEFNGGPTFRKKVGQAKTQVFWPHSTDQQKTLFYDILGLAGQVHRKTKQPTLDKEAIPKLQRKYPWLNRIFELLLELRSINVFASTFVNARTDHDQRMRTSFNPAGTETFRWSSSQNPFDTGCNFQNLPKGKDL
jgi:DNA polymerase I-like protein with 3'-5' exonuclease and polymerase domains